MDPIFIMAFALFLFVGAFMGWKAGSRVSLIMGIVSGAMVLLGGFIVTWSAKPGYGFLTIIGLLLAITFLIRLVKTKKVMPSGMLILVSAGFFILCLLRFINL